MIASTKFQRLLCGAACVLSLSACVTAPTAPAKVATIDDMMTKASLASTAGQNEQALSLWKDATVAYPKEKAPWVQMAQTKYSAGQYGEAIVNAQEILVRDPADKLANSIIAISGLRLSTRALADLSHQNNLTGSLRTESQDLAKLLRESLGEKDLIPVREKQPVRAGVRKPNATKAAAATESDSGSANPFDALK
ncbi:tetratricopeptide (TPR) repeat protein [Oxalobacteraceae bacterium GrIS 1.11]